MWGFTYPAELHLDGGGRLTVRFIDLPEAITSGKAGPATLWRLGSVEWRRFGW